jgi:hypothetical protein
MIKTPPLPVLKIKNLFSVNHHNERKKERDAPGDSNCLLIGIFMVPIETKDIDRRRNERDC